MFTCDFPYVMFTCERSANHIRFSDVMDLFLFTVFACVRATWYRDLFLRAADLFLRACLCVRAVDLFWGCAYFCVRT